MTRSLCLLALYCFAATLLAATLLAVGCADKKGGGQSGKTICRKLHERNRKCVDALVTTLQGRMGNKVPADIKQKLAKQLGVEITKSEFLGRCREQAEAKQEPARTLKKALQKCHAKADCRAYAACFLQAMEKIR